MMAKIVPPQMGGIGESDKKRYISDPSRYETQLHTSSSAPEWKPQPARLIESTQNLMETRRMTLEKVKQKSILKIQNDLMLMRAKLRKMLIDKGDDFDDDDNEELTSSFLQHPGFRYRSNGDVRDSFAASRKLVRKNYNDTKFAEISADSQTLRSQAYIRIELKAIQEELLTASDVADIEEISSRLKNLKAIWKNNDREDLAIDPGPGRSQSNIVHFPLAMRSSGELCKKDSNSSTSSNNRFSKQCSRSNCLACEFRLKCPRDVKPDNKDRKIIRRWNNAPRGLYVASPAKSDFMLARSCSRLNRAPSVPSTRAICKVSSQAQQSVQESQTPHKAGSKGSMPKRAQSSSMTAFIDDFRYAMPQKSRMSNLEHQNMLTKLTDIVSDDINGSPSAVITFAEPANVSRTDLDGRNSSDILRRSSSTAAGKLAGKTWRSLSHMAIKVQLESEKDESLSKVDNFLRKLPEAKPSITRWRTSAGSSARMMPSTVAA